MPLASLLECQTWDEHDPAHKNHIRCREYDLDGHEGAHAVVGAACVSLSSDCNGLFEFSRVVDLQDAAMIADLIAITTGDRNRIKTYTECLPKVLL